VSEVGSGLDPDSTLRARLLFLVLRATRRRSVRLALEGEPRAVGAEHQRERAAVATQGDVERDPILPRLD
jgi:hypothetical protein